MKFWISLVGYQIVWFSAVIGAGHGIVWPGLLTMMLYAGWQLGQSHNVKADLLLIAFAIACGCALDGAFLNSGLLRYATQWPLSMLPPVWILALWISFALTFTQSLKFLQMHLYSAALLGAIGGPLAYLGAARGWHAVAFARPLWIPLVTLAAGWGLVTPLMARLARHWSRQPDADVIHLRRPVQ